MLRLLRSYHLALTLLILGTALGFSPGCGGKSAEALRTPQGRVYVAARSYEAAVDALLARYRAGAVTPEEDRVIEPLEAAAYAAVQSYRGRVAAGTGYGPEDAARWTAAIDAFVRAATAPPTPPTTRHANP